MSAAFPPPVSTFSSPFSDNGGRNRLRAFGNSNEAAAKESQALSTSSIGPPVEVNKKSGEDAVGTDASTLATNSDVPTTTVATTTTARPAASLTNGEDAHKSAKAPPRSSGSGLSISTMWEGVKRMMGFTPDCHNGGYKTISGQCICPQFYEGKSCERIVCANNGTRVRAAAFGGEEVCKCAHPDYITGKHCEVVHCQNGGRLLNEGTCHCVDGWYTGQFCQFYTSSWLIAIGIPLIAIIAIVLCCVVCRLDLCALRRAPPSNTGRHREDRRTNPRRRCGQNVSPSERRCRSGGGGGGGGSGGNRHRREQLPFRPGGGEMAARNQQFYIEQNLLNDRQQRQHQYVLRLEQIPVYNPRLYVPADPTKPLEPPPPYEQAILCTPTQQQDNNSPPSYCPIEQIGGGVAAGGAAAEDAATANPNPAAAEVGGGQQAPTTPPQQRSH